MIWLRKTATVLLLLLGLPVTLLATLQALHPETSAEDRSEATAALFVLGLPPTALGGWLALGLRRHRHQRSVQAALALEQTFIEILQQNQGRCTVLQLATAAQLSLEDAKVYLEAKAVQLNGRFEVTDEGGMVYCFPV